jgi:protein disulfide-isomerase A1
MATEPDTADAAAAGPPEPVAEQKKDKAAPPRDDSLWQSLVILSILFFFVGTSVYIFRNPHSVDWLEERIMEPFTGSAKPKSPFVQHLTTETFDTVLTDKDGFLVEFYAPWCGHCKNFAPEFAAAAEQLDGRAKFGAVDTIANKELGTTYGVKSFPTVIWFVNGEQTAYNAGRTAKAITRWVKKHTGEPTTPLASKADVEELKLDSQTAVLGFFDEGSPELAAFSAIALLEDGRPYGHFVNSELAAEYCPTAPCVAMLSDYRTDQPTVKWTDELDLKTWVGVETFATTVPWQPSYGNAILNNGHFDASAFLFGGDDGLQAAFAKLATDQRGNALFVTVDDDLRLQKYLGLNDVDSPSFVIVEKKEGVRLKKFPMLETIADGSQGGGDSFVAHFGQYLAGELTPRMLSAEPPATQIGSVQVLVGTTVPDVVGKEACVFLEVYAPWCGHCKKLEPIWEKLGASYSDNAAMVVAKMDGTVNEAEMFEVGGYPSLFLFQSNNHTAVKLQGPRNFEALKEFADEMCGVPTAAAAAAAEEPEDREEL